MSTCDDGCFCGGCSWRDADTNRCLLPPFEEANTDEPACDEYEPMAEGGDDE